MHRDAFCPECRGPLDEPPARFVSATKTSSEVEPAQRRHLSEYFTMPGRILVLSTIVLAAGGPGLVIVFLHDSLPAGSYPLWFFYLPVWIMLAIVFCLATVILRQMGIQVIRTPDDRQNKN
jgi:hypothetical protein